MPSMTGLEVPVAEFLATASKRIPNLAGIKYSFRTGRHRGLDVALGSIYLGDRPIDPTPITTLGGLANTPVWTMPAEWRFDVVLRYVLPFKGPKAACNTSAAPR